MLHGLRQPGVAATSRKRARSVSCCRCAGATPVPAMTCIAQHCASRLLRGLRVASRAPESGRNSVWTNRLENPGWARSARCGASTTSAYEVSAITRVRRPSLRSVTRRSSPSSSGGHHYRQRGAQHSVAPGNDGAFLIEVRAVLIGNGCGGLESGGPEFLALQILQIDEAAPAVLRWRPPSIASSRRRDSCCSRHRNR